MGQRTSTAFPHAQTQEQCSLQDSTCFFRAGTGEPGESHMHPRSRPARGGREGSWRSHRKVRSGRCGGRWVPGERRGSCRTLQHTSKSAKQKGKRRSYFKTTSSFTEKSLKEKAVPTRVMLAQCSRDVLRSRRKRAQPCPASNPQKPAMQVRLLWDEPVPRQPW